LPLPRYGITILGRLAGRLAAIPTELFLLCVRKVHLFIYLFILGRLAGRLAAIPTELFLLCVRKVHLFIYLFLISALLNRTFRNSGYMSIG
jgi:hypothetical protein